MGSVRDAKIKTLQAIKIAGHMLTPKTLIP
jgi:hypothetical protein